MTDELWWLAQVEFETVLFNIMWSKGFNQQYVDCYKMVTQFYQQRQPLVIMVCGTAWTGELQSLLYYYYYNSVGHARLSASSCGPLSARSSHSNHCAGTQADAAVVGSIRHCMWHDYHIA